MAAAAEMGVEIQNTRITQPPELYPGFMFYVQAFWRLHSCRPQGVTDVAWIPWTATDKYADRYELTHVAYYRFVYFIERMDEAYRDYVRQKREAEKAAEDSGSNNLPDARSKARAAR